MGTEFDLLSMFLLGLTGSGHCLGMCGPLVIALPGRHGRWQAHLIYHAGRLLTYTAVGALLGGVSGGMLHLSSLSPQQALLWSTRIEMAIALPAALFLLLLGVHRLGLIREPGWMSQAMPQKIPGYRLVLTRSLQPEGSAWLFPMGLMLGFLPCGLSYAAFARALAAADPLKGALLAGIFGLGTFPALMLLGGGAGALWRRWRPQAEMVSGLIMIGMAISLLLKLWSAS